MRRVFIPALLAVALVATSSVNASAFGLFDKLCGKSCDSCCDIEPACGCEVAAPCYEAPTCGCEVVEPCCDTGCAAPKMGLLKRLFGCKDSACDTGCEVIEPACGCEVVAPCYAEPACGCEVAAPCCDSAPKCGVKGLLSRLFKKNSCCDSGCEVIEPACGCEAPCFTEPTCGCEPSCGCGF